MLLFVDMCTVQPRLSEPRTVALRVEIGENSILSNQLASITIIISIL